jgi:hypothetical protein
VKDTYLIVQNLLTTDERTKFLDMFVGNNPSWRGAHVADVLAELANGDSHLEVTEPARKVNADLSKQDALLLTVCTLATLYLEMPCRESVVHERTRDLFDRCKTACHKCNGEGGHWGVLDGSRWFHDCDDCESSGHVS